MSDLVERMAKAMWDRTHDGSWEDRGDGQDESRDIYLADARVGIAAIREPTNLMLKVAAAAMSESKRPTPERVSVKEKHRIRYRAMIDAELSRQTFYEAVARPDNRPSA